MGISETKQARTYVDGWQKPIKEYAEYASNSSYAKENHVYIEALRSANANNATRKDSCMFVTLSHSIQGNISQPRRQ